MKWFVGIRTIEELRRKYRKLLKKYHPDNSGGSVEITQEVNTEYDRLFAILSKEETTDNQSYTYDKDEENKAFKEVLNKVININTTLKSLVYGCGFMGDMSTENY